MTPLSRFTLFHSSLPAEGLVVENPIGWDTAVLSLVRHDNYYSLVKMFKGNFMWYGEGMATLKQIAKDFGPKAYVILTIDLSFKAGVFINIFRGQPKLKQLEEIIIADRENYKMTVPIIRDDFWTKFINRSDSQVNLEGAVDIDGNARTPISKIVLPMPSQKIIQTYRGFESTGATIYQNDIDEDEYIQIAFGEAELNELEYKYTLQTSANPDKPFNLFEARYAGDYDFEARIECSIKHLVGDPPGDCSGTLYLTDPTSSYINFYIQKNEEPAILFSTTDFISQSTVYEISESFSLNIGDVVRIYGVMFDDSWKQNDAIDNILIWGNDNSSVFLTTATFAPTGGGGSCEVDTITFGTRNFSVAPSAETKPTWLEITGSTVAPDTTTDAFLIKDAAESIISKIVGQDAAVKSDYLDTCRGYNAIFRGKHIRGWDFATKQFSMSFDEWWKGANPLLFLGLGYTEVAGVKKIEIEDRAHFFNPTPVVNISNVNKLVRRYDLERIYKSIEVGYKDGLGSESASGIDDTQTKRFFNTDLDGEKAIILCEWIAASLTLERSRRNRIELQKDDKNDEKIMVVALVPDGDDWLPEFGTAFNLVTNLLNSDFRINIRHSATRLFKRAQAWFNGCMLFSETGVFTFDRGEGNYEMTSQLEESDCEAVSGTEPIIDEGANIEADTEDIIFVPQIWEAEGVPLSFETYQEIDENKNNALGISRTDSDHVPMHILDLGFEIFQSKANLLLLQATTEEL